MKTLHRAWGQLLAILLAHVIGVSAAHASPQGASCAAPGWPSTVTYTDGDSSGSGILHLGPILTGLSYQATVSYVVQGNQIQLVILAFDICGIGVPPTPATVDVPIPALAPGQYQVSVQVQRVQGTTLSAQNLPLSVAGTGASSGIPLAQPTVLVALTGMILLLGWFVLRVRETRDLSPPAK